MHDAPSHLPLFDRFPVLAERLPRLPIGAWPTPVEEASQFARDHDLVSFWIKREDLSHPVAGGNKIRGLEFLLADAQRRGAKSILTLSSVGSHHICKTAWHARQLGMDTTAVVVPQPPQPYVAVNLCQNLASGANLIPANFATALPKLAATWLRLKVTRRSPCYIGPGGTSPLACVGHVNAIFELRDQIAAGLLPEPDFLYVPMGSLGTAAGLTLGCALAGLKTVVVGVVVSYRWYCTRGRCLRLARRTLALLRSQDPSIQATLSPDRVHVVGSALGKGYAEVTEAALQWAKMMHQSQSITLDTTYTAKALHGAMEFIRSHDLGSRVHLLWHTYHEMPAPRDVEKLKAQLPPALQKYLTLG